MDIFKIILESSIIVQLVLLMLIVMSVVSWAVVFHYYKYYKQLHELNDKFKSNFFKDGVATLGSMSEFSSRIDKFKNSPLHSLWKVFHKELNKINKKLKIKDDQSLASYLALGDFSNFERSLDQEIYDQIHDIDKHRTLLASIATVAPFVGLFGTVWGIINSFTGLADGGAGTIEAVAPGISEALVATAVGLFAAIPASWFFNYFSKNLKKVKLELESFSKDLLNILKYYSI